MTTSMFSSLYSTRVYRLTIYATIIDMVTLARDGDLFLEALCHTFIRSHTSCIIGKYNARKDYIVAPSFSAQLLWLACRLVLIWRLRHIILAWYLLRLWCKATHVLTRVHVSSNIHAFFWWYVKTYLGCPPRDQHIGHPDASFPLLVAEVGSMFGYQGIARVPLTTRL